MALHVLRDNETIDETLRLTRETLKILHEVLDTVQQQIDRSHVAVADSREFLKRLPDHPLR